MSYTGINMENVKSRNRSAVLKLLNDRGPLSRKDLAAALKLTPAGVTTICSELMDNGILFERGEIREAGKAGRSKILLDINYEYRYVLTFSIEAAVTTIAVCDLRGEHCISRELPTDTQEDPAVFLNALADAGKALLWENGIRKEKLLGAGISVPGPLSPDGGIAMHAYRIWDRPVPVREVMQSELRCPVYPENNVKAFAQAELLYGMGKSNENLIFVKWGPGVGSAIVAHGRIYESGAFKSAEIGHVRVERNGELCRCGRRGCLETRASAHAIARALQRSLSSKHTPKLWDYTGGDPFRITAHDLAEIMALDDPGIIEATSPAVSLLSSTVCNMATMIAPDKVILTGSMFHIPVFLEKFRQECIGYDAAFDEEYIILSDLDMKTGYIGPLAAAVSRGFFE